MNALRRTRAAAVAQSAPTVTTSAGRRNGARKFHGISPETLRQVKLIELRTRKLVNALFTGEYRSVFKGQGMEFSEVREYQAGDEVRSIDWNVTARMNRPFVKRYVEERELTVILVLDVSGSGRFGTVRRFKNELAAEIAAVIAMAAARNNDRVGALFFSDRVEHVVAPGKGRRHVLRVIRDLIVHQPQGTGTDLSGALTYLSHTLRHRSVVFVISDFQAGEMERPLKLLARKHDLVAIAVEDKAEEVLPDVGVATFTDPETGERIDIDTSARAVREYYEKLVRDSRAVRTKILRKHAIDEIVVQTGDDFMQPLLNFFRSREMRRGRR